MTARDHEVSRRRARAMVGRVTGVLDGEQPRRDDGQDLPADAAEEATQVLPYGKLLDRVPAEIKDVSFGTVVRGYDRREVDRYVERVNQVIAELEISQSPQSAVKHALDRVGEQTTSVLQRAREAAEELTAAALAESEHATRRAKVEAAELLETAQAEADALRVRSAQEAEDHLARARADADERLRRAEEEISDRRREAEAELAAVTQDTAAATAARGRALEELRQTAADVEELVRSTVVGASGEQPTPPDPGQAPTMTLPAVEDAETPAAATPDATPEVTTPDPPAPNPGGGAVAAGPRAGAGSPPQAARPR
jgi:DivIVA domain-containing protein